MNPQSNCSTPTNKQTKAFRQAQTDTVLRRFELSSDTVQRCTARTNQAVQEINLKNDVILASSKVKGDHLIDEIQDETASKNDSEDLYKDSFFKSDDSWDEWNGDDYPNKTWKGLPECCDLDEHEYCPIGLKPIKCQHKDCKKYAHHICSITWAEQYQIEEGVIATLCKNHHPGFQFWLKGIMNQDKEYREHLAHIDRLKA